MTDADDADDDWRIVGHHVMGGALLRNELDRTVDGHAEGVSEEEVTLLDEHSRKRGEFAWKESDIIYCCTVDICNINSFIIFVF